MRAALRRHRTALLAGLVGIVVGSATPAVARAAYDALNAQKVDGLYAVRAGASVHARKGKLVATSGSTGRLPNNIIAKAPDSYRLDGYGHSALRTISIDPHGAYTAGSAQQSSMGPVLPGSSDGKMVVGLVVPPDHNPADPLLIDVLVESNEPTACDMLVQTGGIEGLPGEIPLNGGWRLPGRTVYGGRLALPAAPDGVVTKYTFRYSFDTTPRRVVQFELERIGNDPSDTCVYDEIVIGLLARY